MEFYTERIRRFMGFVPRSSCTLAMYDVREKSVVIFQQIELTIIYRERFVLIYNIITYRIYWMYSIKVDHSDTSEVSNDLRWFDLNFLPTRYIPLYINNKILYIMHTHMTLPTLLIRYARVYFSITGKTFLFLFFTSLIYKSFPYSRPVLL